MRNAVKGRAKGEGNGRRRQNAQPAIDREYHGVAIILNPTDRLCMTDFEQLNGRVMSISLRTAGPPIHIINSYAPQSGVNTKQKELFYDTLERHFNKFPRAHVKYILGVFNARLHTKCEHEFMLGPHTFGRGRQYLRSVSDEVTENRRLYICKLLCRQRPVCHEHLVPKATHESVYLSRACYTP